MKTHQLSQLLFILVLSTACSKINKMSNMPKTTEEMNTTTKEMAAVTGDMSETTKEMLEITKGMSKTTEGMAVTTQGMSKTTNDMSEVTKTMFLQLRSKESEATRAEKFKDLLDPKTDMASKITAACVFFKSMEFQLATKNELLISSQEQKNGSATDMMDELRLDAANEFTRRILDLYKKINTKKMTPTKEGKKHSDELAFYAVAAGLHMNHNNQVNAAAEANIKTVSLLDMIKIALKKDQNGEALKEYEEVLMTGMNREVMIELLKARVDIISAIGLSYLADKRQMSLGKKFKALSFMVSGGKIGGLDLPVTLGSSNASTKNSTKKTLEEAVNTRNFLKEISIEKKLEKNLRSAFAHIDLSDELQKERNPEVEAINNLIQDLLH